MLPIRSTLLPVCKSTMLNSALSPCVPGLRHTSNKNENIQRETETDADDGPNAVCRQWTEVCQVGTEL